MEEGDNMSLTNLRRDGDHLSERDVMIDINASGGIQIYGFIDADAGEFFFSLNHMKLCLFV